MIVKVHNRNIVLGFAKISSIFGGMFEIPDIFGGSLSAQVFFFCGTGQTLGPSLCSRKKSEYSSPWGQIPPPITLIHNEC